MESKILCFMQNQWQADADEWNRFWEERRGEHFYKIRLGMIGMYTRTGYSATAKRLQAAFGELIEEMEWENSTWKVGDNPSSKFPPDLEHMKGAISHVNPTLCVAFGAVARDGLKQIWPEEKSLYFKHPVARFMEPGEIKSWRGTLERKIAELSGH